jgi:hypothetical protein
MYPSSDLEYTLVVGRGPKNSRQPLGRFGISIG